MKKTLIHKLWREIEHNNEIVSKNWYPFCIKIYRANYDFSTCFCPCFVRWPNLNTSHLLQWKVALLCSWKHGQGSSKPNFKALIGWGIGRPYKAHFTERGKTARSLENRRRANWKLLLKSYTVFWEVLPNSNGMKHHPSS